MSLVYGVAGKIRGKRRVSQSRTIKTPELPGNVFLIFWKAKVASLLLEYVETPFLGLTTVNRGIFHWYAMCQSWGSLLSVS